MTYHKLQVSTCWPFTRKRLTNKRGAGKVGEGYLIDEQIHLTTDRKAPATESYFSLLLF